MFGMSKFVLNRDCRSYAGLQVFCTLSNFWENRHSLIRVSYNVKVILDRYGPKLNSPATFGVDHLILNFIEIRQVVSELGLNLLTAGVMHFVQRTRTVMIDWYLTIFELELQNICWKVLRRAIRSSGSILSCAEDLLRFQRGILTLPVSCYLWPRGAIRNSNKKWLTNFVCLRWMDDRSIFEASRDVVLGRWAMWDNTIEDSDRS
jgi:hypothetical protein